MCTCPLGWKRRNLVLVCVCVCGFMLFASAVSQTHTQTSTPYTATKHTIPLTGRSTPKATRSQSKGGRVSQRTGGGLFDEILRASTLISFFHNSQAFCSRPLPLPPLFFPKCMCFDFPCALLRGPLPFGVCLCVCVV